LSEKDLVSNPFGRTQVSLSVCVRVWGICTSAASWERDSLSWHNMAEFQPLF